jgi:hypothetical protein
MFPKLSRLSDDQYAAQITVEWKGYVTAEIDWDFRSTNLYWQFVDPVFSQLELGFEYPLGRLTHCAVPLFNGEVEDQQTQPLPQAIPGTPFFDLSPWAVDVSDPAARSNHLEQPGRIRLVKKQNGLSIICKDSSPLHSVLYGDKLICEFGEGDELVALTLVGDFPL